jgi:hypothetical protein
MPNKNTAPIRLGRMLSLAAAGVAALALAGPAQAACTQPASTPLFSAFGDGASYFLAPDGGFEAGAGSWLKTSAVSVNDNEPWHVTGGSKGLLLKGGGASATSPGTCVDLANPSVRLFYKSTPTGGVDSSYLMVEAMLTSKIGTTTTILGTVNPNTAWAPTPVFDLRGATNAHLHSGIAGNDTATLKLRFTVMNSGSSYTLDDVAVDPFRGG